MPTAITTAFVQQYSTNVQLLVQQMGSRFARAVMRGSHMGKAATPVEQFASVSAQLKNTRHGDTPLLDAPQERRWVHPKDYEWASLIDNQDRLRLLVNPNDPYVRNAANAMMRAWDDEVIAAFFAASVTGEDGTGSESFDTTNQQITSNSEGLTVNKLRQGYEKHLANEVDVENDMIWCAIKAKQWRNLYEETQLISFDYNPERVLAKGGMITSFMGINFIHSERLAASAGEDRVPMWAQSGMHLGTWKEIEIDIDKRVDKSNATQVYVCSTIGATRLENKKVVEILCA